MIGKITQLTNEQKQKLLSKTFYALPDNPSNKNFSPSQIKSFGYSGFLYLFDIVSSIIVGINEIVDTANEDVTDVSDRTTNIANFLSGVFTGTIANTATGDKDGNDITETYETKSDATSKFNTNKAEIDKIKDGTTVVEKASKDEDGTSIKTYGKSLSHGLQANATQWTFLLSLLDKNGNVLDTKSQVFGSASTAVAGLLSAEDKTKINAIATDIATALASAKSYADDKVARSNLVSVLGEASQSLNGLMSTTDKTRLDTLFALLGDSADGDTVVNTINEVLAIFNQYPEGADLVSALARKVSFDDIIDNLTSENANKALSANQGKILKGLIDTLSNSKANASDVYNKTETYSQTQADDKFRTQTQVDNQIDIKLAGVSALNVIVDEDNNKNYTYQIKIQNGKAHLIATEVE